MAVVHRLRQASRLLDLPGKLCLWVVRRRRTMRLLDIRLLVE